MGLFSGPSNGAGGEPELIPPQPQSTRSMWGDMLGIGPLLKMISDPALQAHAHQMMAAVIEGAEASKRIEAKLDAILRGENERKTFAGIASISEERRAAPDRGLTLASGAIDGGSGEHAARD